MINLQFKMLIRKIIHHTDSDRTRAANTMCYHATNLHNTNSGNSAGFCGWCINDSHGKSVCNPVLAGIAGSACYGVLVNPNTKYVGLYL